MPTYLRWIAAVTSAITAQFAYYILVGAIAVGTQNRELSGGIGVLVIFGQVLAGVVPALAVNDWLAKRYPKDMLPRPSQQRDEIAAPPVSAPALPATVRRRSRPSSPSRRP